MPARNPPRFVAGINRRPAIVPSTTRHPSSVIRHPSSVFPEAAMVLAANPLIRYYGLYLEGREVEPSAGRYEKINPANEEVLSEAPNASVEDVQRAIAAARRAFDEGPWPRLSGKERARYITRIADLLRKRQDDLVELVIDETGCGRAM